MRSKTEHRVRTRQPLDRAPVPPPDTGRRGDNPDALCYAPPSPQLDPWCSGPTCQPVTLEIAGSNPVGSAITRISLRPVRPPGRGVPLPPGRAVRGPSAARGRLCQTPAGETSSASRSPSACLARGARGRAVLAAPSSGSSAGRQRRLHRPHRRSSPRPTQPVAAARRVAGAAAPVGRDAPADAPPVARPARGRPDRPGHELPRDADLDHPRRARRGPGRHEHPLHRARARLGRGRRDPGRARRRAANGRHAPDPRRRRGRPRGGPHEERQAPGLPARRRGRARRSARWPGATRRSSASIASRTSPTGR